MPALEGWKGGGTRQDFAIIPLNHFIPIISNLPTIGSDLCPHPESIRLLRRRCRNGEVNKSKDSRMWDGEDAQID